MLSSSLGSAGLAITLLSSITLLAIPIVWSLPETNGAGLLEPPGGE